MAELPIPGNRYQALLQVLRTADTVWQASRLFFERWQLSPSQFNVLNLLEEHPNGLSQIDLSRELITHRSNVTGLVDRLEQRGLLERKDLANDRRAYRVVLTASGAALLREILPHYYRKADEVWRGLSTRRVSQITADLKHLTSNAQSLAKTLGSGAKLTRSKAGKSATNDQ